MSRSASPRFASLPVAKPGRPRDPDAERRIVASVLELVAANGYGGLRIDEVARLAAVSKATIYRRWESKAHLAIAAFETLPDLPTPDNGDLPSDLEELIHAFLEVVATTPVAGVLSALVAEKSHNAELARTLDAAIRERRRPFVTALQRAIARREVPPIADPEIALDLVIGPVVSRVFFGGSTSPESIRRLVDIAVRAIAAMDEPHADQMGH